MSKIKPGDYIELDTDAWEDSGKHYLVHSAKYREDTTAVTLELEYNSLIIHRVVARYQIAKVY